MIRVVYEKSTHVVVKFRAYKSLGMQFHEKCFSIWSRTYSNEMRARGRSVCILVGSEAGGIFDQGCLRKKYSCRLSNFAPIKVSVCSFTKSTPFNPVKDLFK